MASLDSGGPIEFLIPGSGDDYLDLANTMLQLQLAAFAVQPGRRLPERHARDLFVQHVRVSNLHRDAAELRTRREIDAADESAVVQGQG